MTRQKIKKPNWQQFPCQQAAACASSQGCLRTQPQRLRPTESLPCRAGLPETPLVPRGWLLDMGGSTPQVRCSDLGFPIPALALTWCQHPPLLLCWCCPRSFHPAPAAGQGKGWAWEAALGLQSAPMGCSDPFRALQFGVLALQQALTSIHLRGFVGNSRERFLLPLLCLFFTLACTERDTQTRSHLPHTNQECCASW